MLLGQNGDIFGPNKYETMFMKLFDFYFHCFGIFNVNVQFFLVKMS